MPVGMHGDDGRYNKAGDRVIVVTMNYVLSRDISRTLDPESMFFLIMLRSGVKPKVYLPYI